MSPDNLDQRLELKLVKFQNVERLCIFVPGNQDECETSAISGALAVEGLGLVLGSSPPACPAWLGSGQGVHSGQVPRAEAWGGRPRTHRARAARTAGILPETVDAGLRRKALERFREINSAWLCAITALGSR